LSVTGLTTNGYFILKQTNTDTVVKSTIQESLPGSNTVTPSITCFVESPSNNMNFRIGLAPGDSATSKLVIINIEIVSLGFTEIP
jgi:hypothetical protein